MLSVQNLTYSSQSPQVYEIGIISILQMRRLRLRERKIIVQNHQADSAGLGLGVHSGLARPPLGTMWRTTAYSAGPEDHVGTVLQTLGLVTKDGP